MRFEFLTAVKMSILIVHVVTSCAHIGYTNVSKERATSTFSPEDGGMMFLRNVGIYIQVNNPLQRRKPTRTSLLSV